MVDDLFGIKKLYPTYAANPLWHYFPAHSKQAATHNDDPEVQAMLGKTVFSVPGELFANVSGTPGGNLTVNWWEYDPEEGYNYTEYILPPYLTRTSYIKVNYDKDCEMDQGAISTRGYVNVANREWRDVEITGHIFFKSVLAKYASFEFIARMGTINGSGRAEVGCCQDTAYGVRFYGGTDNDVRGRFAFFKRQRTGNETVMDPQFQSIIPTFYQTWFGAKFVIFNPERGDAATNPVVRLELWLSPVTFGNPSHPSSNDWTRVAVVEDHIGEGWSRGGKECNAPTDDYPITWACPFVGLNAYYCRQVFYNYISFREIDGGGEFTNEPPAPPGVPIPVPGTDPNPPSVPEPEPPDSEPPITPTTITRRLSIRREVINNSTCACNGVNPEIPDPPPTDPGGGGGGGGTGSLQTLYNVTLETGAFRRMATVAGNSGYLLRFGQGVTQETSSWIGKIIGRVEITVQKTGNPDNGTLGGLKCVIRAPNDSIAATLTPTVSTTDIQTSTTQLTFSNLTNTYAMQFGSKILLEFDGGNIDNYIRIFTRDDQPLTGTKIVWQDNDMEAGEYGDAPNTDICARIYNLAAPPVLPGGNNQT